MLHLRPAGIPRRRESRELKTPFANASAIDVSDAHARASSKSAKKLPRVVSRVERVERQAGAACVRGEAPAAIMRAGRGRAGDSVRFTPHNRRAVGRTDVRVAVTGATGFVGTHTIRALTAAGHEVVAIARGTRRRPRRDNVSYVRADVVDWPGLADTFSTCAAVIHLVAVIREKRKQTFERVNRQASEHVAEAA